MHRSIPQRINPARIVWKYENIARQLGISADTLQRALKAAHIVLPQYKHSVYVFKGLISDLFTRILTAYPGLAIDLLRNQSYHAFRRKYNPSTFYMADDLVFPSGLRRSKRITRNLNIIRERITAKSRRRLRIPLSSKMLTQKLQKNMQDFVSQESAKKRS